MQRDDRHEWDVLEGLWRAAPANPLIPENLRARVLREQRWLRLHAVVEWLLAISLLAWCAWKFATAQDARDLLRAGLVVFLTAVAMVTSIALRRGLWVPADENARAYLEISRARLAAGRRTLWAAWLLYFFQAAVFAVLELAVATGVLGFALTGDVQLLIWVFVVFGIALAAWSAWYAYTLRGRERAMRDIERELKDTDAL